MKNKPGSSKWQLYEGVGKKDDDRPETVLVNENLNLKLTDSSTKEFSSDKIDIAENPTEVAGAYSGDVHTYFSSTDDIQFADDSSTVADYVHSIDSFSAVDDYLQLADSSGIAANGGGNLPGSGVEGTDISTEQESSQSDDWGWLIGGLALIGGMGGIGAAVFGGSSGVDDDSSRTTSDATAPDAPIVSLANDSTNGGPGYDTDKITNDGTLKVIGEADARIEYSLDGVTGWSTTAPVPTEGDNTVYVHQIDKAGNVSDSTIFSFKLDTTAPAAPTASLANDTGISNTDGITNVSTVNVAGIETGATWGYQVDGGAWTAGSGTSFDLSAGTHTYTLSQTDAAGNTSEPSAALNFTYDAVVPTVASVVDNVAGVVNLATSSIDYTYTFSEQVIGTLQAGDFDVTNGTISGVTQNPDGTWTVNVIPAQGIAADNITIALHSGVLSDNAGNTNAAHTENGQTIDTLAPNITLIYSNYTYPLYGDVGGDDPVMRSTVNCEATNVAYTYIFSEAVTGLTADDFTVTNGSISSITGSGDTWTVNVTPTQGVEGFITLDLKAGAVFDNAQNINAAFTENHQDIDTIVPAAPVITGISSDSGVAGDHITNDKTLMILGTAEANSTVQVFVDGVSKGTATANGAGAWTFDYTGTTLADGTYQITAKATDDAENTSTASGAYAVTVDTAISAPFAQLAVDNGISNIDLMTSQATVNVYRIESGATWEYSLDNGTNWINGTGNTIDGSAFSLGPNSLLVRQTDAAGNQSTSGVLNFTLGTAPSQTVTIESVFDNWQIQRTLADYDSNDDGTPTFNLTLSAPLNAGETIAVYDNGIKIDPTKATITQIDATHWTFTTDYGIKYGPHEFSARVENNTTYLAGQSSEAFHLIGNGFVSNIGVYDDVGPVVGSVIWGGTTDDSTPMIAGTLFAAPGPNEHVAIYEDSSGSWVKMGNATVSGKSFFFATSTPLPDGYYSFTARIEQNGTDEAHIVWSDMGIPIGIAVPHTPAATITSLTMIDDVGVNQDDITTSGQATDDPTPGFRFTLSQSMGRGESLLIYDNNTLIYNSHVYETTFEIWPPLAAGNGAHVITAQIRDASGMCGELSPPFVIVENGIAITGVYDDAGGVIGKVASGGNTDDTTPTLIGTLKAPLSAGEKVSIYDGAVKLGEATVNDATWTYLVDSALALNAHTFVAKIETATDTAVIASGNYTVNILAGADPTQTVTISGATDNAGVQTGALTQGQSTDDTTLTLSGTLDSALGAGDTLVIYDGSNKVAAWTGAGTSWSCTTSKLSAGVHNLIARVENISGDTGDWSSTSFSVIENAITITGIADDAGAVTGTVANNGATDDATPTISGTLLAPLAAGEKVSIYDGATKLGEATLLTDTTWTYTPASDLSFAAHAFTAKIESTGGAAEIASANYTVTTITNPTQTVTITGVIDDAGVQQGLLTISGQSVDDTTLTVSGTLSAALNAGDSVVIYDGATKLGAATVSGTTWTYAIPTAAALGAGTHDFAARVENAEFAGPFSSAFNVIENAITITGIADDAGAVVGMIANNGATDDTNPTLSGTLIAPLASGEKVSIYDGAAKIGEATVNGTDWTFTTPGLGDGAHAFTAVIESSTGISEIQSSAYNITTVAAPVAPQAEATIMGVIDNVGVQQGGLIPGQSTDDATPTLTGVLINGSLGMGDAVYIYDNGVKIGIATVAGDNTWSYTPSALSAGSHVLTAQVENAAGQASASSSFTLIENSISISSITDDAGLLTGNVAKNGFTDDATPVISGTLDAPLAADEHVSIYDSTTLLGEATVTGTTWSFAPTLSYGAHTFIAKIESASGTAEIASGSYGITTVENPLDATVDLVYVKDNFATIEDVSNGYLPWPILAPGQSTDDLTPTLYGTLSSALNPGETVGIYDNGVRLGTATINSSTLTWSYAATLTEQGIHNFTAQVENNITGNVGSSSSYMLIENSFGTITATDDFGAATGTLVNGAITDDKTPILSGTLGAALGTGEKVFIYDGAVKLGEAAVTDTSWTFAPADLSYSAHTFTARIESSSGVSLIEKTYTLNVQPQQTIMQVNDDVGALTGSINGITDDTSVTVTGTITGFGTGDKLQVYDGSNYLGDATMGTTTDNVTTWSYAPADLSIGSHTISTAYVNAAGATDTAHQPGISFDVVSSDPTFDAITNTDPVSGMFVKTISLTGANQTLSLTGFTHPEIDVVNLAGSGGSNTLNISLADVLDNGTDLFNNASGWSGTVGGVGVHQMVVNGNADDTVNVVAGAGTWTYAGTTVEAYSGNTYAIYDNLSNGAELLIDQHLQHVGAIA